MWREGKAIFVEVVERFVVRIVGMGKTKGARRSRWEARRERIGLGAKVMPYEEESLRLHPIIVFQRTV